MPSRFRHARMLRRVILGIPNDSPTVHFLDDIAIFQQVAIGEKLGAEPSAAVVRCLIFHFRPHHSLLPVSGAWCRLPYTLIIHLVYTLSSPIARFFLIFFLGQFVADGDTNGIGLGHVEAGLGGD